MMTNDGNAILREVTHPTLPRFQRLHLTVQTHEIQELGCQAHTTNLTKCCYVVLQLEGNLTAEVDVSHPAAKNMIEL